MREHFLQDILSQPSAPFREGHVIAAVLRELDAESVPYFQDPIGNIVVGASSPKDYATLIREHSDEPLRFFIAHMDHPGFHGHTWTENDRLEVKWHGGSPTKHLIGAKVWLADQSGFLCEGKMTAAEMIPSGRAIARAVIQPSRKLRKTHASAESIYGGFHFRDFVWEKNGILYTKAADDLVGAYSICCVAIELFKKKRPAKAPRAPFLGLLTRAEEVGFVGAIGHFELGWLQKAKRPVLCVSLETSRALPGAEIGKGPVVRLGDKYTVFDPGSLRVFTELAEKKLKGRHQRRVMDGGTCEATAATVYGFPCVGISVPLGNYHNQSFEGGPDSRGSLGPAPEFVHRNDVAGLLDLCSALMTAKLPWNQPWDGKLKGFRKALKEYRPLLESGP